MFPLYEIFFKIFVYFQKNKKRQEINLKTLLYGIIPLKREKRVTEKIVVSTGKSLYKSKKAFLMKARLFFIIFFQILKIIPLFFPTLIFHVSVFCCFC